MNCILNTTYNYNTGMNESKMLKWRSDSRANLNTINKNIKIVLKREEKKFEHT